MKFGKKIWNQILFLPSTLFNSCNAGARDVMSFHFFIQKNKKLEIGFFNSLTAAKVLITSTFGPSEGLSSL